MDTGGHHPVAGVEPFKHRYGFLTEGTDPHRGLFQGVVGADDPDIGHAVFRRQRRQRNGQRNDVGGLHEHPGALAQFDRNLAGTEGNAGREGA
ncbi:hypothetical protein D3C78_1499940 [compost metagenome]